jgi:hypothetical protein
MYATVKDEKPREHTRQQQVLNVDVEHTRRSNDSTGLCHRAYVSHWCHISDAHDEGTIHKCVRKISRKDIPLTLPGWTEPALQGLNASTRVD